MDDNHDAPEAPFLERASGRFSQPSRFSRPCFMKQPSDFLSAVAVKAGDEVDASRPQTFVFFEFDVHTIEEDGEHVGVMGQLTSSSSSMKPEATVSSSSGEALTPFFLSAVFAAFTETSGANRTPKRRDWTSSGVSAFVGRRE